MEIEITVLSAEGEMLQSIRGREEAMLCINREYRQGDRIRITADRESAHLIIKPDMTIEECEVFLPSGSMEWPVPWGEHRLAYCPGAFTGSRHAVWVREMKAEDISSSRNIALNPADLRGDTDFYPHVTANVETRGESCFAARNVIDGMRFNTCHGEWPFQSWGIGAREDAWCLLEFGREIIAEKMALTLRADFPHDAYWTEGHVVTDQGEDIAFALQKTGDRQWIPLGNRRVRSLRLERLIKSDDPSAFPALTEWEVIGHDL